MKSHCFQSLVWNVLASDFHVNDLLSPRGSCSVLHLPSPPWGGEYGASSAFFNCLDQVPWTCFLFELLHQPDTPDSIAQAVAGQTLLASPGCCRLEKLISLLVP